MLLKNRSESDELLILRSLNTRMGLTEKEKLRYSNLEKGFKGELKFDQMAESLQEERLIIDDILFEENYSYFQIDKIMISQRCIHLLDTKNFEYDCYFKSDKLYSVTTGCENMNPLDQLKRSTTLFRKLLQSLRINYPVESFVIFINPEFTLYQAHMDQPIILPGQVNRFLKKINQTPSKLNDGHMKLAQKLISLHQTKNPYAKKPNYTFEQLSKGAYCKNCKSFRISISGYFVFCEICGELERIELAILRNAKEFNLLFPERKITTQSIFEWCNMDINKKTICRALKKNFSVSGSTKGTFYEID